MDPSLPQRSVTAPLPGRFDLTGRLVRRLQGAYGRLAATASAGLPAFRLILDDGAIYAFGEGRSAFELTVRNRAGRAALTSGDETRFAEAYMAGDVDFAGDVLALISLRGLLSDRHPVQAFWYKVLHAIVFGQARSDRKWVARHYDEGDEFYLLFLDRRRCYSHGLFERDDERSTTPSCASSTSRWRRSTPTPASGCSTSAPAGGR